METGLKQYPDDVKLKKLYELLKTTTASNNRKIISRNKTRTSSRNRINRSNRNQTASRISSRPNKIRSHKTRISRIRPTRKTRSRKNSSHRKNRTENQNGGKPENQNEQNQPVTAGQMTPEEAKRLLDAQKGDEQFLQLKPQGKPQTQPPPVKDW